VCPRNAFERPPKNAETKKKRDGSCVRDPYLSKNDKNSDKKFGKKILKNVCCKSWEASFFCKS
jgi:hypothetical protein